MRGFLVELFGGYELAITAGMKCCRRCAGRLTSVEEFSRRLRFSGKAWDMAFGYALCLESSESYARFSQ